MLFTPDKDKEVMLYPAFVCLLETSRKTTDRIFANILPEIYLWAGKNWFSFGRHPHLDPDQGIFKHLPTFRDMTFLHNLTHISGKTDRFFMQICITDISMDNKVYVKSWKSSGSGIRS